MRIMVRSIQKEVEGGVSRDEAMREGNGIDVRG